MCNFGPRVKGTELYPYAEKHCSVWVGGPRNPTNPTILGMVEARSGRHHREQKDGDSLRSSRRQQDDVAPLNGLRDDLAWLKRSASLRRWGHGRRGEMRVALVALILATWLVCVVGDCWNVALNLQDLCEDAIGNEVVVDYSKVSQAYVSAGRRRLLWHGGGAEAEDVRPPMPVGWLFTEIT